MPTKRTRLSRQVRPKTIDPALLARFTGRPCPAGANRFKYGHPRDPRTVSNSIGNNRAPRRIGK